MVRSMRSRPASPVNGSAETDTLYPALVAALAHRQPAYLHVVFADPESALFQRIRNLWPNTLIANPNLGWDVPLPVCGGTAAARALLAAGADLVSLGCSFLANPDLVDRLRTDAPLNPVRGAHLMYVGGAEGYTDYPVLDAASDVVPSITAA
ncbi:hypothetical protein ACWEP5_12255 [Nocardia niigatensis]